MTNTAATPSDKCDISGGVSIPDFQVDISSPMDLLALCPVYAETECRAVAFRDTGELLIKNESTRLGLGSFKALGGVYAVASLIADGWFEEHGERLQPDDYTNSDVRAFAESLTFICASAGNHGLAVAAGAKLFGAHAKIFLSESVPRIFANRLQEKGAEVVYAGATYEQSVEAASADAAVEVAGTTSILLADSSWPGYWRPPSLIMEGYAVLAEELRCHFEKQAKWPTHVFLQAGVGGLAAAVTHMIRQTWAVQPEIVIVEPDAAPCLKSSDEAGCPVQVDGPISNMGRLDCKAPSLIAYKILQQSDVRYQTVSDEEANAACAELEEFNIGSTASGAAGFAGLKKYFSSIESKEFTRPLIIVSEGSVA
jgi:diaminopropionate ammonia-lyase